MIEWSIANSCKAVPAISVRSFQRNKNKSFSGSVSSFLTEDFVNVPTHFRMKNGGLNAGAILKHTEVTEY